ncbi:TcpE family conjugal transfer membrane protein [Streptococcus orisasini]
MSKELEEFPDKRLYCYTKALSQPIWIQRISEDFSLPSALKLSKVIYTVVIYFILSKFLKTVAGGIDFGLRITASGFLGWYLAGLFSELRVDGKTLLKYLKDYLIFYFRFGLRQNQIYLNKGQIYKRPKAVMRLKSKG